MVFHGDAYPLQDSLELGSSRSREIVWQLPAVLKAQRPFAMAALAKVGVEVRSIALLGFAYVRTPRFRRLQSECEFNGTPYKKFKCRQSSTAGTGRAYVRNGRFMSSVEHCLRPSTTHHGQQALNFWRLPDVRCLRRADSQTGEEVADGWHMPWTHAAYDGRRHGPTSTRDVRSLLHLVGERHFW